MTLITPATATLPRELRRLAAAWGVHTSFYNNRGQRRHTSVEALLAVLRSLGAPVERLDDVPDALRVRRREHWQQRVEPVVTAWDGLAEPLELRLPAEAAESKLTARLTLESGETRTFTCDLAALPALWAADVDGRRYVVKRVALAEPLPPGYHVLDLQAAGVLGHALILSAPSRLTTDPDERSWGGFLPLYALRSADSRGCGDLSDLGALAAWIGERGGRSVCTLPLLATFLDGPLFQPSPYVPASRLGWNELFADLSREPEWQDGSLPPRADDGDGELLDYAALFERRRPVLQAMADAAFTGDRREEIERFLGEHPHARDYARFRAACTRFDAPWCHWPEAARTGTLADDDLDPASWRYHAYAQFITEGQLTDVARVARERGVRLALDMPLGVHPDGYDTWAAQHLFARGVSCGAPPDGFFTKGQDWGFPPLLRDALRADGYRYLAEVMRHHLTHCHMLRIDHAIGLHRQYWVPHGMPATDGAYVRNRPDEHYAVLTLEASRAGALIIGEDLGTVPRGLRAAMARHGLWRTHVMQFMPDAPVPAPSVACLNTHDMPPFASFQQQKDIDIFRELELLDDAREQDSRQQRVSLLADLRAWLEVRELLEPGADGHAFMRAAYGALGRSRATMVMVNLEDLWNEERPHNVPGTSSEQPNWKRPARHALEDFSARDDVEQALAELTEQRTTAHAGAAAAHGRSATSTALGELHLDLLGAGRHTHVYDVLGSHSRLVEGVPGTRFVLWAPRAERVAVMGDFNAWDDARHPLTPVPGTALWEGFVPGASHGARYHYRVTLEGGEARDVTDPVARCGAGDGSRIWDLDPDWHDHRWRAARGHGEVKLARVDAPDGSWTDMATVLADAALSEGATHVVLPRAAYQSPASAFAPDADRGTPDELAALVDTLHVRNVGVLFEWGPDGLPPFCFVDDAASHPEHAAFLASAARQWVHAYHADGLMLTGLAADERTRLRQRLQALDPQLVVRTDGDAG
jgi:4-alpha-glucanotransferase